MYYFILDKRWNGIITQVLLIQQQHTRCSPQSGVWEEKSVCRPRLYLRSKGVVPIDPRLNKNNPKEEVMEVQEKIDN